MVSDRRFLVLASLLVTTVGCFKDTATVGGPDEGETTGDPQPTDEQSEESGGEGSTSAGPTDADSSGGEEDTSGDGGESSTGEPSACGNGVVDDDEECDGGEGCTDCVLDHYICNPLNQVGCADTQTCDRTRGATLADQRTGCFQNGEAGYLSSCTYDPLDPALQCADGLSCVGSAYVPGCEGLTECCTEFCTIGGAPCPDAAQQCLTWKEIGMPPGLDALGLCIRLP